jgi:hypothetical protein
LPSKSEKLSRQQILNDLKQKAAFEFAQSLPLSIDFFHELFEYLRLQIDENGCDHTFKLADQFVLRKGVPNTGLIRKWLNDHGAYCDCEVLANIEELFEKI